MPAWQWLCEALFPERCIICKREGRWFCERHNEFGDAPQNEANFKHLDKIYAATAYYDPNTRKAVEFFKFRGFTSLADTFAEIIADKTPREVFEDATLVPVPLHWSRKWWRGFNQAEKIAKALQKRFPNCEVSLDLMRVKKTKQQAKLKKKERQNNLKNAFEWRGKNIPRKVILVDDVVASGGTLDAAAQELHEVGVKKVIGVVFARGGKA